LLAEDNSTNQMVALHLLARLGYQADLAENGWEVLSAVRRRQYDVILMDVQMPALDGLETARRIRADFAGGVAEAEAGQGRFRPHMIAMTANAMLGDREACLAAGMQDYVSKPIRVRALVDALSQCPVRQRAGEVQVPAEPAQAAAGTLSSPEPAWAEVLDPAALNELCLLAGGDTTFLTKLIATFFLTAEQLFADLRQAAERREPAALTLAAHSLKGNSRQFGAPELANLCFELEAMGRAGQMEGIAGKITQAEAAYRLVSVAVEQWRRSLII
jgi:CheY-like chemotaxis protein